MFNLAAVVGDNDDVAYILWYDGNTQIGVGSSLSSYVFDEGLHIITAVVADNASPPNTSRSHAIVIEITPDSSQKICR